MDCYMKRILDTIQSPEELRTLAVSDLPVLADELRETIIDVVSHNGGHLASSLGVVDLTVALHYSFRTPKDRIIWDVGHQSYAHKLLTGRRDSFATIRRFGGLSGFPKVSESKYDTYDTGHSSTSISLAIGEAAARDIKHEKHEVIAVIGDGSLTGGLCYEALNQIGQLQKEMIIILNDNEHSISPNVGAMSQYLTRLISGSVYNAVRKKYYNFLKKVPYGKQLWVLFKKVESRVKGLIVPGQVFEELGLRYFGPVDGHNIEGLILLFERLKKINSGPKIVHVITRKGKGYSFAEKNPSKFHGIGAFNRETGETLASSRTTWSDVAGKTLARLAEKNHAICAVTAAMKDGTGLTEFEKTAPHRFFDVGIAEEHAVVFASALAKNGLRPFVAVYSTFLQRAYDQLIHDVGIMNLPVTFLVDRAGIVGEDGETHHGLFDLGYIRTIPNFMLLSPRNGEELRDMVCFAASWGKGPVAIRYPRGAVPEKSVSLSKHNVFVPGAAIETGAGCDVALVAAGEMVHYAHTVAALLHEQNVATTIVGLSTLKPLDMKTISAAAGRCRCFVTIENGYISGGIGEEIVSLLEGELRARHIFSVGFPDKFITHGKADELYEAYGLSHERTAERIIAWLGRAHGW
jgi:1-deoxy-D-xylulose-5-phosphate synthase